MSERLLAQLGVPRSIQNEITESITQEAERIVNGDRNAAYGDAEDDFRFIGMAWAAAINSANQRSDAPDIPPIEPRVVAMMMVQLKCIRHAFHPKRDNLVDIVGYALCSERCEKA